MTGFFSKLFGGKKKAAVPAVTLVQDTLAGLIDKAQLDLDVDVQSENVNGVEEIRVELSGVDEMMLTEREGALLDAFQLFAKRMLQHQLPEARVNVSFDSNGYREETNRSLVELADRLKEKALEQGRSVYLRALPPKDRKIVHQYLANDDRVRSRSVGDGLYKKIKIYPVKSNGRDNNREMSDEATEMTESV